MLWTCKRVRKCLSLLLDGELSERERKRCEAHMRECVACRAEWRALQLIREAMHSEPRLHAPMDIYQRIAPQLETIAQRYASQREHQRHRRYAQRWLRISWALAVSVVLAIALIGLRIEYLGREHTTSTTEIPSIYIQAHMIGANEAQLLPNPATNILLVNVGE